MMKKGIVFLAFALIAASGLFAQDNWISGEVSILGGGVRYERMLSPNLSVGVNAYYSMFPLGNILQDEYGGDASIRFYPWAKTFFVGLGLGYHVSSVSFFGDGKPGTVTGFAVTPELGWKIAVGNAGFFLQPGVKVSFTFGPLDALNSGDTDENSYMYMNVVPYFGMGFAF